MKHYEDYCCPKFSNSFLCLSKVYVYVSIECMFEILQIWVDRSRGEFLHYFLTICNQESTVSDYRGFYSAVVHKTCDIIHCPNHTATKQLAKILIFLYNGI